MWLAMFTLSRAALYSLQMCSKLLSSFLNMIHRSCHRLCPQFSPSLPDTLGYNDILHFSKSPCFLSLGIGIPLTRKSFPLSVL